MKFAILGAGQLGGSFALALKAADPDVHITLFDTVIEHASILHTRGAADMVVRSAEEAARHADIIMLATPLRSYSALAQSIASSLSRGAIVTDVGSVKRPMQALATLLPDARIVPAHPIAGTEKSGPLAADGELFRGKLCLLTPDAKTDAKSIEIVQALWHAVGADVTLMPTEVHDQIYAEVSHLPHCIAFVTAAFYAVHHVPVRMEDASLRQFLRIACSDARMWVDILLENREAILSAAATYRSVLEHMIGELTSGKGTHQAPELFTRLLPRMLASTLISGISLYERQANISVKPFAGAGLRDMTAPAMQPPEGDLEAISNAAESVAESLRAWLQQWSVLENAIGGADEAKIFALLSTMRLQAIALLSANHA